MKLLLVIGLGGAFGAIGRHFVISQVAHWFPGAFPIGTLTANVVGSFAMGLLVELMALTWSPSPELRALLTVGFLGAFTTFSTFSMEVVLLYERGALGYVALYVACSVVLSVGAFFLAMSLVRGVVV